MNLPRFRATVVALVAARLPDLVALSRITSLPGLYAARALLVASMAMMPGRTAARPARLRRQVPVRTLGIAVLGGLPMSLATFGLADGTAARRGPLTEAASQPLRER